MGPSAAATAGCHTHLLRGQRLEAHLDARRDFHGDLGGMGSDGQSEGSVAGCHFCKKANSFWTSLVGQAREMK